MSNIPEGYELVDTSEIPEGYELVESKDPSILQKAAGAGEVGLSMASGVVGDVLGGASGVLAAINPFDDISGGDQVKAVQEMFRYDPRTEQGQKYLQAIGGNELVQKVAGALEKAEQYTGDVGYATGEATGIPGAGPVLGGAYSAIPTALGEIIGGGAPGVLSKQMAKRSQSLEDAAKGVQGDIDEALSPVGSGTERSTQEGMQEVADVLSNKKPDLAKIADFDPEVLRAASELGFSDIPPAVAANNAQLRDITMGMASMSGSVSKAQYGDFVDSLSKRADELIKQGGGR